MSEQVTMMNEKYQQRMVADINVEGAVVSVDGAIHTLRSMGEVTFLVLRRYDGLIQCVYEERGQANNNLRVGMTVNVIGNVVKDDRAPRGYEIHVTKLNVLSEIEEDAAMPLAINKWKLNTSLEAKLEYRPISLRNIRERAVFKFQEGIVRGFRDFLYTQNFTEIHTPKIVSGNAEGGANVFKLDYFGKKAFLAQSPQFYKQMMVGVYDRVFEVAPVFRAEKHNTKRHLNEYISMDFEMGYIDSFMDIIKMEQECFKYIFRLLEKDYEKEMNILKVELPDIENIPMVRFDDAKRLVSEKYDRKIRNPYDLEPEEEVLIGKYFKEEYDSDLVFVTYYPTKKRPFYAMEDSEDRKYTLSFDLLFKGMEITTGGQRIHSYKEQVEKMIARGMNPEDFKDYLSIHKYGMPPHGGLGIGLERLTMRLLNEDNVRETAMFPRDLSRLRP